MNLKWQLALIFVAFLALTGALGLQDPDECEDYIRASDQIRCFHRAAITGAYICVSYGDQECFKAVSLCRGIWSQYQHPKDDKDDTPRKAELVHNACFFDIAKILRNPGHCRHIDGKTQSSTLVGHTVTYEMCLQEAADLAQIEPAHFLENNPDSICTVVFVLPLLLAFSLRR